jgi:hypothetical protein
MRSAPHSSMAGVRCAYTSAQRHQDERGADECSPQPRQRPPQDANRLEESFFHRAREGSSGVDRVRRMNRSGRVRLPYRMEPVTPSRGPVAATIRLTRRLRCRMCDTSRFGRLGLARRQNVATDVGDLVSQRSRSTQRARGEPPKAGSKRPRGMMTRAARDIAEILGSQQEAGGLTQGRASQAFCVCSAACRSLRASFT